MKTQEDIEQALSLERFSTYLAWSGNDHAKAVHLYTLNTLLSESLYTPLQTFEIALRNRIHTAMSEAHNEEWFHINGVIQIERQRDQLADALVELKEKKKSITSGAVVAELSFSFWTSMIGKPYENLWQQTLHQIAKKPDDKGVSRKNFAKPVGQIRLLRNRVAHHEPIINWNLPKHYGNIMERILWMSSPAHEWCRENARFEATYPEERIELVSNNSQT